MSDLLLMSPPGLPRTGLVGLWDPYRDTYGRNVLPVGSEDFAPGGIWIGNTGVTLTITPNQPAHDGTSTAFRVQSSGGASAVKLKTSVFAMVSGATYQLGIWVKNNTNGSRIGLSNVNTTYETSTDWHLVSDSRVAGSATASFYIGTDAAGTDLDVTLELPQLNLGPVLFPYSAPAGAPGTLQTSLDYSGNGNHLTLGATTNASFDDPAFTGTAWSFDGGDYLQAADAASLDVGQFSVIAVMKSSAAGEITAIVDKSAGTGAAIGYGVILRSSNPYIRLYTYDTSLHGTDGTVANPRNDAWRCIGGTMKSGAQAIYIDGSCVATGTLTYNEAGIANGSILRVGAQSLVGFYTGSFALVAMWNRALTQSEYLRAYAYLKSLMAGRGVTLA